MFDVSGLVAEPCKQEPIHFSFEPTDVQLFDLVLTTSKAQEEPYRFVSFSAETQPRINSFLPQFPLDRDVIAIDSTSVVRVCPVMHIKADHQSGMTCDVRWFFEEDITGDPEIAKIADIENVIKNDIITICQECMEKMKQIVLESEQRFSQQ